MAQLRRIFRRHWSFHEASLRKTISPSRRVSLYAAPPPRLRRQIDFTTPTAAGAAAAHAATSRRREASASAAPRGRPFLRRGDY